MNIEEPIQIASDFRHGYQEKNKFEKRDGDEIPSQNSIKHKGKVTNFNLYTGPPPYKRA